MFVVVKDPETGQRLGKAGLLKHAQPLIKSGLFRVSVRRGIPGLRGVPQYRHHNVAAETRSTFAAVKKFVSETGVPVKVETTQREANALLGGHVMSNGGTYRLQVSEDRTRVVTLYGHGA